MNKFMKLKNGEIIFVFSINEKAGIVHGCNVCSPYLRDKAYNLLSKKKGENFDHNWNSAPGFEKVGEINKKMLDYKSYKFGEEKHHGKKVTEARHKKIVMLLLEEKAGIDLMNKIFKGEKHEKGKDLIPQEHPEFQKLLEMLRRRGITHILIYEEWNLTFEDNYSHWFIFLIKEKDSETTRKKVVELKETIKKERGELSPVGFELINIDWSKSKCNY